MKKHNRITRIMILVMVALMIFAISVVALATQGDGGQQPQGPAPVECYLQGDVNGDGEVTDRDAIYLLYNYLFGDEAYPLRNDDKSFDDNAAFNDRDAVTLLYCTLFGDQEGSEYYGKLQGVVHTYGDPVWSWEDDVPVLTIPCLGCDQHKVYTSQEDPEDPSKPIVEVSSVQTNPTCVDVGFTTYTAVITLDETEYKDTYVSNYQDPTGDTHNWDTNCGCGFYDEETGKYTVPCLNPGCDAVKEVPGHRWKLDESNSQLSTCTVAGYQYYVCEDCSAFEVRPLEKLDHTWEYVADADQPYVQEGVVVPCTYAKTYKCKDCDATKGVAEAAEADIYTIHVYKAEVVKEVNCTENGTMKYTCTNAGCTHFYTETIEADGQSHVWGVPTKDGSNLIYRCTCGAERVTVDATAGVQKAEEGEKLGELALEANTTLTMDDTLQNNLEAEKTIKITVDQMDKENEDLNLTTEQQEKIGNAPVYDFNMFYADEQGNKVSDVDFNGGKVTITLPYQLQENEDIENIAVWYIDNNGQLSNIRATYSNGYVTFETSHFSYYTVTRLTAKERCDLYGHVETSKVKDPTCTEDGYVLTLCQRCGEEREKKTKPALGHAMTEQSGARIVTTEATCITAGSIVTTCGRSGCNHKTTVALPILGHDLPADPTNTVAASCAKPGKNEYKCQRAECDFTYVEPVKQLTHSYQDTADVAATCEADGYKEKTCEHCGDVVRITTSARLGHNYCNTKWNWDPRVDPFTISVTITCANSPDCPPAVCPGVIEESVAKAPSSCEGDGAITYKAKATHSGKPFWKEESVTTKGPGHKIGTDWDGNINMHYHICKTCGQQVGSASHSWNSGIQTKAPTCTSNGTKQYRCTVCGYTKTETVPATGVHSFVDNECSYCGALENECEHLMVYKNVLDTSKLGICGDVEFVTYTCDCGKYQEVEYYLEDCEFEEGDVTIGTATAPNGQQVETRKQSCKNCGITLEFAEYFEADDECFTQYYSWGYYSVDGKVFAEHNTPSRLGLHVANVLVETIDLSQYGLCEDMVLYHNKCECGRVHNTDAQWESFTDAQIGCNWEFQGGSDTNGTFICSDCGAKKTEVFKQGKLEGCVVINGYDATYYTPSGEKIATYAADYCMDMHPNMTSSMELLGTYCTDGVIYRNECPDCNWKSNSVNYGIHTMNPSVKKDLSAYGVCPGSTDFYTSSCICPVKEQFYYGFYGCSFQGTWDPVAEEYRYACINCGTIRESKMTPGATKDADCYRTVRYVDTYKDSQGNVIAVGTRDQMETDHVYKRSYDMKGKSCADGMTVTGICQDCGDVWSYETDDHEQAEVISYDLSAYGACVSRVSVYSCPCEEEGWLNWFGAKNCNWQWVPGGYEQIDQDNYTYTYQCADCGLTYKENVKMLLQVDPCHAKKLFSYEFSKDGNGLMKFSYTTTVQTHDQLEIPTLVPGATTCADGYTVTWYCINEGCDDRHTSDVWYGCEKHRTSKTLVSTDDICSDIYTMEFSCACGAEQSTETMWDGESCRYENNLGYYDEDLDTWVNMCSVCHNKQYMRDYAEPIEGDPCHEKHFEHLYFMNEKNEPLFDFAREGIWDTHDWQHSFNLLGTTCNEGYTVSGVCKREGCDGAFYDEQIHTGCNQTWRVYEQVLLENESICGTIKYVEESCPCGGNTMAHVDDWQCSFSGFHDPQTGMFTDTCENCGLKRIHRDDTNHIPGTCTGTRTMDYTYELNGQTVATFQKSVVVTDHDRKFYFNLNGSSCEDGYTVSWTCRNDGCSAYGNDDWERWDHEFFPIERTDLSEAGVACGSSLGISGCPCGEYRDVYFDNRCDLKWVEVPNGMGYDVCQNPDCGVTIYQWDETTESPINCTRIGTRYIKIVDKNGNEKTYTLDINEEWHEWEMTDGGATNGDCEQGFWVEVECKNCHKFDNWEGHCHEMFITDTIDLGALGACGGVMRAVSCPCGKESHIGWEQKCDLGGYEDFEGDDYNGNLTRHHECRTCGLKVVEQESWSYEEGTCYSNATSSITVSINGFNETMNVNYRRDAHDWLRTGADLAVPGGSCEDGVTLYYTCNRCGRSDERQRNEHELGVIDTFDLSQYGANCGDSKLNRLSCACGEYNWYEFDKACKCDFGRTDTDLTWLADYCNNDLLDDHTEQWTSEGEWHMEDSHAHFYGCAVTNADCTVKIRMANYWRLSGCIATRYQTWQVWDENTQTYVDLGTIATGEVRQHHTFDVPDNANNYDQIVNGARVYGTVQTCTVPGCGSYNSKLTTDQTVTDLATGESYQIPGQYQEITVNTTGNGDPTRREFTDTFGEWVFDYNNDNGNPDKECFWFTTQQHFEEYRADGTVFTEDTIHTHDFANKPCWHTINIQNSDGHNNTWEDECHFNIGHEEDNLPTCSQGGEWGVRSHCPLCDHTYFDEWGTYPPTGHRWSDEPDPTTGRYVCSECGLESEKAYSGSIIMEDLTDTYGGNTEFVIGYHKDTDVEFNPELTVILEDVSGDNELYLEGITFSYTTREDGIGVTALYFDQAATLQAAADAVANAGYTGDYAVRISFVPVGGSDLDYAITFDTITQNTAA